MDVILLQARMKGGTFCDVQVDAADAEMLKQYRWYVGKGGYIITVKWDTTLKKRVNMRLHKLLMPNKYYHVDHINGDKLDNRRCNLRYVNQTQNNRNRGIRKNNKSGYKGVSWNKACKKWAAHIMVNRKSIYLGLYDTPESAHKAYCEAAKKYHGDFHNVGA